MGEKVPIARVARAHGMKGEVKVLPYLLQNAELIRKLPRFFRRKGKEAFEPLTPESIRQAPGEGFLIKFEEVSGRDEAELLHGEELLADLDDLPPKEEGEFYVYELVGLKVKLPDGSEIGKVIGLMPVGPYDLLEIRHREGKTFYVPLIEEMILKIDLEEKEIVINPQEGLLEAQLGS